MKRLKYLIEPLPPSFGFSFGTTNGSTAADGAAGKWKQTKLNFGSFVATAGFGAGGGAFATTSVMAPRLMKAEPGGKKHIDIMVSFI